MIQLRQFWDRVPPVARFAAGLLIVVLLLFLQLPIWLALPLLLGGVALALVGAYGILVGDVDQARRPRTPPVTPPSGARADDEDFEDWNDSMVDTGNGGDGDSGSSDSGGGGSSGGNGGGNGGE
ncbi:MAG: hypothetical protein U5L04_11755 [Trueperaceae bacterium]|nr:hypothetical protein [Trueperaceae bacterium]